MAALAHKGQIIMGGDNGVTSFNGRSGAVTPQAGDYDATQVNYSEQQTVKQKIDVLVTEEASDIAGQQSLLKDTVGFTGKNRAYSQTNNAVIASIESGKSYTVSWTGSATITLKKDSASGTEITSGSTSPLTFTADADYDLYFGSSADVTQIMVCYSELYDGEYEDYHDTVETMFEDVADDIDGINLLENEAVSTGIFTVNADKSVTINGTASETFLQFQIHGPLQLPDGNYVLTGITELPEGVYWSLQLQSGSWIDVAPGESSKSFTLSSANPIVKARIYVASGTTLSNLVIYPMITEAKYAGIPYRPYNQQSIQHQINDITGVTGVRNWLRVTAETQTNNGITYTVNKDSNGNVISVVLNGTATAFSRIYLNSDLHLEQGKEYIVSDGISRTEQTAYSLRIGDASDTFAAATAYGVGNQDSFIADTKNTVQISIQSGATANNLTFKPMIKLASDPSDEYVPYAMTNRELTEELTVKSLSPQVTGASFSNIAVSFNKYGKLVTMYAQFKSSLTTLDSSETMFILPVEYRPSTNISVRTYDIGTSCTDENQEIQLLSSGEVSCKIRNTHNTGRWICANLTYMTK